MPRFRSRLPFAAIVMLPLVFGCGPIVRGSKAKLAIPGIEPTSAVYTLTNLHPDNPRPLLWSKNFLRGGLIPVCTEVAVTRSHRTAIWFRIPGSKVEYRYQNVNSANPRPFRDHLGMVFGPRCPSEEIDGLAEVDRRHIEAGTVGNGMTKAGVIFAIGYPPEFKTPDREVDTWTYWRSRVRSFDVVFGPDGRVISGEPPPLEAPGVPPPPPPAEPVARKQTLGVSAPTPR
jgi:hypothetical protein